MARLTRSVGAAFVIVAAWTIYDIARSIRATGSGGLGAVSFGTSEEPVELLAVIGIIWIALYVKSKIQHPRKPATRR